MTGSESGEARALRMLYKHTRAVVSTATTEPGNMNAGRKNLDYATVAVHALTWITRSPQAFVVFEENGGRKWATLTDQGRAYCEAAFPTETPGGGAPA